jgi:sulfite dehydrogenase
MMNRRTVLKGGAVMLAGSVTIGGSSIAAVAAETIVLPFENGERRS